MQFEKNRKLISGFNAPMAIASLAVAVFVFWGTQFRGGYLIDAQDYVLGRDFLNFWFYGIAAWDGEALRYYNPFNYNEMLDRLAGFDYPAQNWSYPPHYMLLAAPFGLLPYHAALAAFTGLGMWLYWRVVVKPFGAAGQRIALFATPTVAVFLVCGQASAFLAVILVAIYNWLDRRPVLAGLLIALLTVKPQIGLLIPLFLILTRRWQVFGAAAAGTLGLIGLSVLLHGAEVWKFYLTLGVEIQAMTLTHSKPVVMGLMPTAFVQTMLLGGSEKMAWAAQALSTLGAVAFMAWMIHQTQDRFLRFAALICASMLATPYLLAYDTLILVWVMLMLANRTEMANWQGVVYRLVLVICPLGVALALNGIPGMPLAIAGVAAWIWQAARAGEPAGAKTLSMATAP